MLKLIDTIITVAAPTIFVYLGVQAALQPVVDADAAAAYFATAALTAMVGIANFNKE